MKHPFAAFRRGCIRISAAPFEEYVRWTSQCMISPEAGLRFLILFFEKRENNEALFIASKSLWERHAEASRTLPAGEECVRLAASLSSYFSRMCFRSTPFGGFATVRGIEFGDTINLESFTAEAQPRLVRIDSEIVYRLSRFYQHKHRRHSSVKYQLNNTALKVGSSLHYYETVQKAEGRSTQRLIRVDLEEPLLAVLEIFDRKSALPFSSIVDELCAVFGAESNSEIEIYIDELIQAQLLSSSLTLPITLSIGVLEWLAQQLDHIDPADASDIRELIRICDSAATRISSIKEATDEVEAAVLRIGVDPSKHVLQVDQIAQGTQGVMLASFAHDVNKAIRLAEILGVPEGQTSIDKFRDAFVGRYGEHFVPILLAMDEEVGIGFSNSAHFETGILAEIKWQSDKVVAREKPSISEHVLDASVKWDHHHEVDLASLLRDEAGVPAQPVPEVSAVMLNVLAKNMDELKIGNYLLEISGGGPMGGMLFSRFAYGSEHISDTLHELALVEASRHDAILAELAFQPNERLANVSVRPRAREFELEILANSEAPENKKIKLDDMLIGVVNNRVVLWSKSRQREVLVRHTTAYNGDLPENLGIFQFLCRLQWQSRNLFFAGNLPIPGFGRHSPRLVCGRVLVKRATWSISRKQLDQARIACASGMSLEGFCAEIGLPKFVLVGKGDNKIVYDLSNPIACVDFLKRAKDESVLVEEAFPRDSRPWMQSKAGFHHQAELVFPLVCVRPPASVGSISAAQVVLASRTYPLGSNWLSVKIYAGRVTRERIVREVFPKIVGDSTWFFLRYNDPESHLRFRVRSKEHGSIISRLYASIENDIGQESVSRIESNVYVPEVSRYGGPSAMPLVEDIFHFDSIAALEFLSQDPTQEQVFAQALRVTMSYFKLFGLDMAEQRRVLREMSKDMHSMISTSGRTLGEIGSLYRKKRSTILAATNEECPSLARLSYSIGPLVQKLSELSNSAPMPVGLNSIMRSLIHMSLNRLFSTHSLQQEAANYDLLQRFVGEQLSRMPVQPKPNAITD